MRVSAWMRRTLVTIDPGSGLSDARRVMERNDLPGLPVTRDGKLVGMLSGHDIDGAQPPPVPGHSGEARFRGLNSVRVADVMSRDVTSVAPVTPLAQVARLMRDRAVEALPVLKAGELVGVVSVDDLLELLESHVQDDADAPPDFCGKV
jgi:CBS domain-containing protein